MIPSSLTFSCLTCVFACRGLRWKVHAKGDTKKVRHDRSVQIGSHQGGLHGWAREDPVTYGWPVSAGFEAHSSTKIPPEFIVYAGYDWRRGTFCSIPVVDIRSLITAVKNLDLIHKLY